MVSINQTTLYSGIFAKSHGTGAKSEAGSSLQGARLDIFNETLNHKTILKSVCMQLNYVTI